MHRAHCAGHGKNWNILTDDVQSFRHSQAIIVVIVRTIVVPDDDPVRRHYFQGESGIFNDVLEFVGAVHKYQIKQGFFSEGCCRSPFRAPNWAGFFKGTPILR